jgi:hypothetical protein
MYKKGLRAHARSPIPPPPPQSLRRLIALAASSNNSVAAFSFSSAEMPPFTTSQECILPA